MTNTFAKRIPLIVLGAAVAAALTLASGLVQGTLSQRWGPPADVARISARLAELPREFGPWKVASQGEMDPNTLEILQCSGHVVREYVDQETGESVNMALILGPSGPVSVHTPEICYSSRDFSLSGERAVARVGEDGDAFWGLTFRANNPVASAQWLRVAYGWSLGGPWSAAESPRVSFAGKPYLYKIQVASQLPVGADVEKSDPCRRFLEDFVPVARDYLVPPGGE
ncbi:MAG: exosortase-associated EpsI family protein [Pirellulales bacterium]|nr:exosortase-associated EpsI family protein [Pirellulales bacterium]